MSQFKNIFRKTPLIALAALPLTVGAVLAQQSSTATANPATQAQPERVEPAQLGQRNQNQQNRSGTGQQTQRQQGSGTNYADVYLQQLSAGLRISLDKLKAAALAAGNATLDQGVKSGDIAANRAADMKTRLKVHPFGLLSGRGMGGRHMDGPDRRGGRDGGPRGSGDGASSPQGQTSDTDSY